MKFATGSKPVSLTIPDRATLLQEIADRMSRNHGFALATLNVDHLQKMQQDEKFTTAYRAHDLIVADGNPIVWLSRLRGDTVELVPGSELVEPLCALAARFDRPVAIICGSVASGQLAADRLCATTDGLRIVMIAAPGFPFDPDGAEADDLIQQLKDADVGLCLLAVGAPRQERFAARAYRQCPNTGFASIGAGVDFIAGTQTRAPAIVRKARMEWLWRAALSPARLGPRYIKGALILPGYAVRAMREKRSPR